MTDNPGTDKKVGPGLAGLFASGGPTLPNGQPINTETVTVWIRNGGQGKIGVMPPLQRLKEGEIEEIIEYLQGL
jgi:hypothetical protein